MYAQLLLITAQAEMYWQYSRYPLNGYYIAHLSSTCHCLNSILHTAYSILHLIPKSAQFPSLVSIFIPVISG